MSLSAIRENKILEKISEIAVEKMEKIIRPSHKDIDISFNLHLCYHQEFYIVNIKYDHYSLWV